MFVNMEKTKKVYFVNLVQFLGNIIAVFLSYVLTFFIKTHLGKPYTSQNIEALKVIFPWILISFVILHFIYRLNQLLEMDFYEIFLGIVFSSIFLAILALAFSFFFRAFSFPRSAILYSFIFQIIFLTGFNFFIYQIFLKLVAPIDLLFLTYNENNNIVEELQESLINQFNIEVYTIKDKEDKEIEDTINQYRFIVLDNNIDIKTKEKILLQTIPYGKKVYIIPSLYEIFLQNTKAHFIGDISLLEISTLENLKFEGFLKRILDVVISIIALIVFSPVILVTSILIAIESGFPIFYLQDRVGANGKIFKTIKFRTMVKDAEKYTGAVLSSENDPRITKVGKFLRKTGVDEIPQFINVLKGEMSVVGPRPERPELIEKIKENVKEYDLRLMVKPGITGFAQLFGKYDTPFDRKLVMDLVYANQKSIVVSDIFIMFNTIKLFFSPHKRK